MNSKSNASNNNSAASLALMGAAAGAGAALSWALLVQLRDRFWNRSKRVPPSLLRRSPFAKELRLAVPLALQAGANMVEYCQKRGTVDEIAESDLAIDYKGQPEDFCTAIDWANEELITRAIQANFPSHHIIGEESTGTGEIQPLTDDPTWILDPIDGTVNFASGLPMTCVSIGFCVGGKAVMGVVYAPLTDELFVAVEGFGAYRNGVRLSSQKRVTALKDSVVVFEFGYARSPESVRKMVGAVGGIMNNGCKTARSIGSGVLDLCYVACGKVDVVYAGVAGEGWKPWDHAAGYVLATEAGCTMEALVLDDASAEASSEFDLYSKSLVCGTSKQLVDETRKVVLSSLT